LAKLERERSEVLYTRRKLFTQLTELNDLEEELQQFELERQRRRYLQILTEISDLQKQLSAVDEADAEVRRWAEELARWEVWDEFPIQLRDEIIKIGSQRERIQTESEEIQKTAEVAQEKTEALKDQITKLKESIADLENVREVPLDELPQIQELYHEWKMAVKTKDAAADRFEKSRSTLETTKKEFIEERAQLQSAIDMGHTKLAELQQRLLNSRQQVEETTQELIAVQEPWEALALDEAQLKELEIIDQHLQSKQFLVDLQPEHLKTLEQSTAPDPFPQIADLQASETTLNELQLERQELKYLQALTENNAIQNEMAIADASAEEVARCAEEVAKWEAWSTFPVNLHEDVIRLTTERGRFQKECARAQELAQVAEEKLPPLTTEIATTEGNITSLKKALDFSTSEAQMRKISELINEREKTAEVQKSAEARWEDARAALQESQQRFDRDQAELEPILELGSMGLAGLQHLLRDTRSRVDRGTESLSEVESTWTEAGMEEERFQEMERAAEWIQSGAEGDSKRSKHLSGLPMFRQSSYSQKELVVYGWLKTAYGNLVRSRAEANEAQDALDALEAEVRSKLGNLIEGPLTDQSFEQLGKRLDSHLRASAEVEQQKIFVARLETELYAIRQKHQRAERAVTEELANLGLRTTDLEEAINTYQQYLEQKKPLEREETKLERLRLQVEALNRDLNILIEKQSILNETELELRHVLSQAGIDRSVEELEVGLDEFNQAVSNYNRWSEANSIYQGTLKHHALSDDHARARLGASISELETRLVMMLDDYPELSELTPDKSYIEYTTLNRKNDEALLAEREAYGQLKDSIHQAVNQAKQRYDVLSEAQTRAETAQEALDRVETEVADQLGEIIDGDLDSEAFTILEQSLERHLRTSADVSHLEEKVSELSSELETANQNFDQVQATLQTKLASLGQDITDLQPAYDAYIEQSERKQHLERNELELEQLNLQLNALSRDVESWQIKQQELEETETALCELLMIQAGIDCTPDTIEIALTKFSEGINNSKRWENARATYEAALKHQSSLPDTQACMDMKSSLTRLELTVDTMREEHPGWVELKPDKTSQAYGILINEIDEEKNEIQKKYSELKNEIDQTTYSLRHPAELDEETNDAKATVDQLESFRGVLELAHGELARAAQDYQKRFAPKLELLMDESLSQISQGRYSKVRVDPKSLAVFLTAPELGDTIGVERLSTGTRDLVYLTLRVGIAQLMSRTGEKLPLLLDDPLVQFDRDRQEEALEYLTLLAEQTQVFMFTKDEWMKDWFDNNKADSPEHSVHILYR